MAMKFFILGLGSIGTRHARNLLALGHEVWGYDKSVETALQAKEQIPGLEIAADMFDCDAYVICTPPDQHIAEMINAVEAGKHIFVEKPIGVPEDIEPLGKLLEEANRKNLVVMVGNMLRFHPEVRKVKPFLINPLMGIFRVLQKNERYTEPVFLNWGAHEIDLALYFFGPARVTDAMGGRQAGWIHLRHENGVKSSFDMDYLTNPEVRKFEIDVADKTGNRGATFECNLHLSDWNDVYMDEMKEFITRIESGYAGPAHEINWAVGATGFDGLATLKIIAEAMRMAGCDQRKK